MRPGLRTLLPFVAVLPLWATAVQEKGPAPIEWRTDLAQAEAAALQARKPMLVVFRCKP